MIWKCQPAAGLGFLQPEEHSWLSQPAQPLPGPDSSSQRLLRGSATRTHCGDRRESRDRPSAQPSETGAENKHSGCVRYRHSVCVCVNYTLCTLLLCVRTVFVHVCSLCNVSSVSVHWVCAVCVRLWGWGCVCTASEHVFPWLCVCVCTVCAMCALAVCVCT